MARDFLDITPAESIAERIASAGWDGLTDAEREIACLYRWKDALTHGGIVEIFCSLERFELEAAHAGLLRLRASNAAALFREAMDIVAAIGIVAPDGKEVEWVQQLMTHPRLQQIEVQFAESEVGTSLGLPEVLPYAQTHPDLFPGPRTLLELWASMRARGINEKPQRLLNFERQAISDAAHTDRRCRHCGQPVPNYKTKCRRCGRPYDVPARP